MEKTLTVAPSRSTKRRTSRLRAAETRATDRRDIPGAFAPGISPTPGASCAAERARGNFAALHESAVHRHENFSQPAITNSRSIDTGDPCSAERAARALRRVNSTAISFGRNTDPAHLV